MMSTQISKMAIPSDADHRRAMSRSGRVGYSDLSPLMSTYYFWNSLLGDSCHPFGSEAVTEVFFDNVSLMLFWVLSVYNCIKMSPKNWSFPSGGGSFPTTKGGGKTGGKENSMRDSQKILQKSFIFSSATPNFFLGQCDYEGMKYKWSNEQTVPDFVR